MMGKLALPPAVHIHAPHDRPRGAVAAETQTCGAVKDLALFVRIDGGATDQ
jgi:hypothetical protein